MRRCLLLAAIALAGPAFLEIGIDLWRALR